MPRPSAAPNHPLREAHAAARVIEGFQAAFLEVATATLPPAEYVVKGGVNVRFFYGSLRSSKDMDFDYIGKRFPRWEDRVNAIFDGNALERLLRLRGIRITALNRLKKQTDITRRWTMGLATDTVSDASSKVEFSGRTAGNANPDDYEVATMEPELARTLGVGRVAIQRYRPHAAMEQKVIALRQRTQTEPRDVFDLDFYIRQFPNALRQATIDAAALEAAVARARALTFNEYESAVVPFLEEELWPVLGTREAWEAMRTRVIDALESQALELLE